MTSALRRASGFHSSVHRPRAGHVLFKDAHLSDVWNDAQRARTVFARAYAEALARATWHRNRAWLGSGSGNERCPMISATFFPRRRQLP